MVVWSAPQRLSSAPTVAKPRKTSRLRRPGSTRCLWASRRRTKTAWPNVGETQNKGRDLVESVKRLQRAGLQVQGGFIVGFDNDTPSIFQQQIDFIQKSGIVTAMVGLLQAPPGTRLYERMKQEGRLVR